MAYPKQEPGFVEQTIDGDPDLREYAAGDPVGAFSGYLRRPRPSAQGMTAQFFGENGKDADTIAVFHLTQFKDMLVKISVHVLKDANGAPQGREGKYPLLTEFIGTIRRPAASENGQTAAFFAANGIQSDAVNVLNQSRYLDALVYITVTKAEHGQMAQDIETQTDPDVLNNEAKRTTSVEIAQIKRRQKTASEGWRILRTAGFFRNRILWSALGGEEAFAEWLRAQPCTQPGDDPCTNQPCVAYRIPGTKKWGLVSLCEQHAEQWEAGDLPPMQKDPNDYLSSVQLTQASRWAEQRVRQALGTPEGFDPLPSKIFSWAVENQVRNLIPNAFLGLLGDA